MKNSNEKNQQKQSESSTEIKSLPVQEIIHFPTDIAPIIDLSKEIDRIEKDVEKYQKVAIIAVKQTKESDWIIHGESGPYLMERGSRRIATAFGVHIAYIGKPEMEWHEDKKGRYFIFVAYGKAFCRSLGVYIEEIGTSSQRDKFFGMVRGELRPLEEVDINMIRKKSVTNLDNRIIKRVTGLLNVTVEDLKAAGLNIEKIHKVEYREGKQKVEKTLSKEALQKRKDIDTIALQMAGGQESEKAKYIKNASYFKIKDKDSGEEREKFAESVDRLTTEKWIAMSLKNIIAAFRINLPGEDLPIKEETKK